MDRCPNCRARVQDDGPCRRCGMELGLLLAVEQASEAWLRHALQCLSADDRAAAEAALRRSLQLRQYPEAQLLLGFVRSGAAGHGFGDLPA
jgi:hypothetical protein